VAQPTITQSPATTATPSEAASPAPQPRDTAATLTYLIEEEKLAHDVYVTLYSVWGTSVFANISDSETTHQELLVPLLADRGLVDPRSPDVGVFTNPELQSLYTELVARGSTSVAEAIQVGILIEEKDIVDLTVSIAAESDASVVSVYERLLAGSQSHLTAFERKA